MNAFEQKLFSFKEKSYLRERKKIFFTSKLNKINNKQFKLLKHLIYIAITLLNKVSEFKNVFKKN